LISMIYRQKNAATGTRKPEKKLAQSSSIFHQRNAATGTSAQRMMLRSEAGCGQTRQGS